jgi:hypothetical protein
MNRRTGVNLLIAAVSVVVIASVIGSAYVLGSPEHQRQRRLDERRVRDLGTITNTINSYAVTHDALPPDLSVLGSEPGQRRAPVDPDSSAAYEYSVQSAESYQLCAIFALASPDRQETSTYGEMNREDWTHQAGRQCFKKKQKIGKKVDG